MSHPTLLPPLSNLALQKISIEFSLFNTIGINALQLHRCHSDSEHGGRNALSLSGEAPTLTHSIAEGLSESDSDDLLLILISSDFVCLFYIIQVIFIE